jgi:hypothetical protein
MRRSSYEHDWGKQYDRPTIKERVLAGILRLIPPIGPLRTLKFKMPTPPVEKLFMQSFDRAAGQYGAWLDHRGSRQIHLDNINYDVGVPTKRGDYKLEDSAYVFWLNKLAEKNFSTATPQIRTALLTYYRDPQTPAETKKAAADGNRVLAQLKALRATAPNSITKASGAP